MDGPQTFVLAQQLAPNLCARAVERIDVPPGRWQANMLLLNSAGQVIQQIRSYGRWLFFDFSHGLTWATHLTGKTTWSISPPSAVSRAAGPSRTRAAALLRVHLRDGATATLSGQPKFLILPTPTLMQHETFRTLGPDPLVTPAFTDDFPPRLRRAADSPLAAALTKQHIVAGLGHDTISELLFALRLAPSTRVGSLLASQIDRLATVLVQLSQQTADVLLGGTVPSYQVFSRTDQPCPRCRTSIATDGLPVLQRIWFCPRCQTPPTLTTLFTTSKKSAHQ